MTGKRRGHGDGALYQDPSGRWVGALDLGRDATGRRRRVKVHGRTRADARSRLAELRRQHDSGLPIPDRQVTVATLCGQWLDRGLPAGLSSPTTDNYRWAVDTHIGPVIGARRLAELTPEDVEGLLDGMAAAGLSRRTMALVRAVLSRVLRFGMRRGLVVRNVAELAEVPDGPKRDRWSLTVEQGRVLLDTAAGDRLEGLLVVGLLTGLRPGELLGLAWDAIDLDAGTLDVRQALRRTSAGLDLVAPKTRSSIRRLDLPPVVVATLRTHRVRQATDRLAAGELWVDAGLVFTTEIGTPIDPSNLRRRLSHLAARAGVGHVHPHLLRHSAASLLSAANVPLEQVADVLGHRSASVTAAVYRHPTRATVAAGSAPMQEMFGGTRVSPPPDTPAGRHKPRAAAEAR